MDIAWKVIRHACEINTIMTSWGNPISTHLATYKIKNARISCHWLIGGKMKFRDCVRGDLYLCLCKWSKESLTPGKPNSYSPKPTRETKGTAESGLKNLKIRKLINTTLNFSKESNYNKIFNLPCWHRYWNATVQSKIFITWRILRLMHDIWHKCFKLSMNCFESNSTISGFKLTLQHYAKAHWSLGQSEE